MTKDEYLDFQVRAFNEAVEKSDIEGLNCELCGNKKAIAVKRGEEVRLKECKCVNLRRATRMISTYWFGKRPTIEGFDDKQAFQKHLKLKASEYLKSECENWFFIGGQSGAGKTHICTAISYELIEKRAKTFSCLQWVQGMRDIKAAQRSGTIISEIEKYKMCDILYIDDLFKGSKNGTVSDFEISVLFEILNHRYQNVKKITLISSEYTLGEICAIDEACGSRIKMRAGAYAINIEKSREKNYRLLI